MRIYIRHCTKKYLNGIYNEIEQDTYYNHTNKLYMIRSDNKFRISRKKYEHVNFLAYYDINSCNFFIIENNIYKYDISTEIEFDNDNFQIYPNNTKLKKIDLPLYVEEPDIVQGNCGNCWLISTLIALNISYSAENKEIYVIDKKNRKTVIKQIDKDIYEVFLFLKGESKSIKIKNDFPFKDDSLIYVKSKCLWPLLIEKAFFFTHGYKKLNSSYSEYALNVLQINTTCTYLCKNNDNQWLIFNGKRDIDIDMKILTLKNCMSYFLKDEVIKIIKTNITKSNIIIVSINSRRKIENPCCFCKKFLTNHTYVFNGIDDNNNFTIRDPCKLELITISVNKFFNVFNCISFFNES
ncbi:putative calpain family thiol protease [Aureococcus anophagefferens virus]|uniref:Putative calpain family thiol protease n=1 Tax=Aureococcus anophagefferens virus TaxID=1474867 RepID=A0A076FI00_9VIRU|nr:putative calpain family thiol protease [Aureococcus anophagefferens virus]AII17071.1 putative calpain family thiol protease [Aureococcus anophagefferens virus]UOG94347.1 hypothetical protein MKD35_312 [Aureococcus anophagefferens virus]